MHPYVYCGYLSYWFYFTFCKKFCLSVQQGHGSDVLSVPALCHTVILEALGFWGVELVAALGLSCPLFPGGRCVSPTSFLATSSVSHSFTLTAPSWSLWEQRSPTDYLRLLQPYLGDIWAGLLLPAGSVTWHVPVPAAHMLLAAV